MLSHIGEHRAKLDGCPGGIRGTRSPRARPRELYDVGRAQPTEIIELHVPRIPRKRDTVEE